jgi:predicted dinucleotide-binding enzyme
MNCIQFVKKKPQNVYDLAQERETTLLLQKHLTGKNVADLYNNFNIKHFSYKKKAFLKCNN